MRRIKGRLELVMLVPRKAAHVTEPRLKSTSEINTDQFRDKQYLSRSCDLLSYGFGTTPAAIEKV